MNDVLSLAARLAKLDMSALRALLLERDVTSSGIEDYFDLAELLLSEESIRKTLVRLERPTLALLAGACSGETGEEPGEGTGGGLELQHARALLLVEQDASRPITEVCRQLTAWRADGLPDRSTLAFAAPPTPPHRPADGDPDRRDKLAAERAFATTAAITELLSELAREPARELARGGPSAADLKRLANALDVELEFLTMILSIARKADLVTVHTSRTHVSLHGEQWQRLATATRWAEVAQAWLRNLDPAIRSLAMDVLERSAEQGQLTVSWLESLSTWLYPGNKSKSRESVRLFGDGAEILGITANGVASGSGQALLCGKPEDATATMSRLFPAEVEQVYLQHDLTIVSPGPLAPAVDSRLRTMSEVESRAQASTYRISAGSIQSAFAAGETAASILDFLSAISLTGVPQPLEYLVSESAARHGLIRVGKLHSDAYGYHSYVTSSDAGLLSTIEVDRALAALRFTRFSENRLQSRSVPENVYWSLADAKYPAAVEDGRGRIVAIDRYGGMGSFPDSSAQAAAAHARPADVASAGAPTAPATSAPPNAAEDAATRTPAYEPPPDPVDVLVNRLITAKPTTREQGLHAWRLRQLETAIREKTTLVVSVQKADKTVVDYVLEPASIFGGRLRARDRARDVERTFPVSHIVGLSTPEA